MFNLWTLRFIRTTMITVNRNYITERRKLMKYTLKMLRASRNWSQVTAAMHVGVSVDTWGNWERKRSFPDVPHIKKIQEVFNVSYDDIIFL